MDIQEIFGKIGFDPKMAIFNAINFLIFFIILNKLLFSKVGKVIHERQEKIDESLKYSEKVDTAMAEIEEKKNAIIKEANERATDIVETAEKNATELANEQKQRTAEEIEKMTLKSKEQLEIEKREMMAKFKTEAADLTIMAAKKIVEDKVDEKSDRKLIDTYLSKLEESKN